MENTTRDFWKMIVDCKVSAIVMLCELEENGNVKLTKLYLILLIMQEPCYQYWNLNDVGEYHVQMISERKLNGYIERMFKILSEKDVSSYNVVQFQITDWAEDGIVREPRTVLQVIDDVIHRQQKIGGGPVVVHCR